MAVSIFISAWQISSVENFGSEESKKFYEDIYNKYEEFLFLMAAFLIATAKILATFLFSDEFYKAWIFTPVLIYAFVFNSMANFYGSIYTSGKKTKMLFISTSIGAGANVFLNFLLIPLLEAQGAAIATAGSYFLVWLIRFLDSKKILSFKVNWKRDFFAHILLVLLILLLCIDFNPYLLVSISAVALMCIICRKTLVETMGVFLAKIKRLRNGNRKI